MSMKNCKNCLKAFDSSHNSGKQCCCNACASQFYQYRLLGKLTLADKYFLENGSVLNYSGMPESNNDLISQTFEIKKEIKKEVKKEHSDFEKKIMAEVTEAIESGQQTLAKSKEKNKLKK